MPDTVIPDSHKDLLDQALIVHLATVRPDGSPQSNPVWFEWDGQDVRISQTRDRQKFHNIERDGHVALSMTDPSNPYRYIEIRGVAEDVEPDDGNRFIDHLAKRYLDEDEYPWHQPGDERVIVHIRPVHATSMG